MYKCELEICGYAFVFSLCKTTLCCSYIFPISKIEIRKVGHICIAICIAPDLQLDLDLRYKGAILTHAHALI